MYNIYIYIHVCMYIYIYICIYIYIHRIVYRWFLLIYQVSYVLGIVGYLILLLVFTGVGLLLPVTPDVILEFGVTLVFYGVYYGVMGRDCAEVCVDFMAASMTVRKRFSVISLSSICSYIHSFISPFMY